MDLKALSQLYWLRQEIKMDEDRVAELRDRLSSLSVNMSGMPSAHGNQSKIESYTAAIVDLISVIEQKKERCVQEQKKLETFIASIEDSLTRQIFTLRFVEGMSYRKIGRILHNTEENIRQICCRYVHTH